MLDITTTATVRPDLFYQTLKSFTKNLFTNKKEYRLILNIDPIGEDEDPMEMVKVGKKFFNDVVYNIPDKPNFAQACKWCWQNADSEYIFHLEDDWELERRILIGNLCFIMQKNINMMSLRMPKSTLAKLDKKDVRKGFIHHHKLLLNPTLFRGDFIRDIASKMNIVDNPEKQLRKVFKLTKDEVAGIYCGLGKGVYLKHNGRRWQRASNYKKIKGSNFITWEKK
jgi:hypothetical protein